MPKTPEQFKPREKRGTLPIPRASTEEEMGKIVILKFPLKIGFMAAPVVLDKIKEFAKQGNVELSYRGQSVKSALYDFELKGKRQDVDNVVEGINNIIGSL